MTCAAILGLHGTPAGAQTSPSSAAATVVAAARVPNVDGLRDLGRAPQSLPVSLALTLSYRNAAELRRLIDLQSDSTSRYYHRYLTNEQFAAYFAPSTATEADVIAALERAGFQIANRYANRTVVDAVAPAAIAEKYFQTEIHRVQQAGAGLRYANVRPALLPAELRNSVLAVTGLTNVIDAHSDIVRGATVPAQTGSLAGTHINGIHPPALQAGSRSTNATSNELRDPSFESGHVGPWGTCFTVSASDPSFTTAIAHTGRYSAFAGSQSATSGEIYGDAGVCQNVTIPTNGILTFWVNEYSNEKTIANGFQEADLLDIYGNRVVNLYAAVANTHGWKQLSYNLSKYAGGRYLLYFGVEGYGNPNSETYQVVDDVSLTGTAYATNGAKIGGPEFGPQPNYGYGPVVVANGYDLPVQHGYDGAGRTTGIEIAGDYHATDLGAYLGYFGITRGGSTTRIAIDGGSTFSVPNSLEVTLDVETIVALAPATELYIYEFPDLGNVHIEDGYNRAVSDNIADVVNSSFGGCETYDPAHDKALDQIVAQGAAKGMTFVASSGDLGSATCAGKTGVQAPASTPDVVAVGGTSFYASTSGYNSESAWKGSGGGVSQVWAKPTYQSGIAGVVGSSRNVPDIAMAADPNTPTAVYFNGAWTTVGGTSWASPIFTALQTEIDQGHNSRFGYVNPTLYSVFTQHGSAAFHDITAGSNGAYTAHGGYDNVTGLGSLKGLAFAIDE